MKTLIVFYSSQISQIALSTDLYDIVSHDCHNINDIYYDCPKKYFYFLFVNNKTVLDDVCRNVLEYIDQLTKYKPAIFNTNCSKIYHRSIIHFIFPILPIDKNGQIRETIERIFTAYTYPTPNSTYATQKLHKWFNGCVKKQFPLSSAYIIADDLYVNFLEMVKIYEYFNIEHDYFKTRAIHFHKNEQEMYGICSMHHFRHDFANIGRNSIINHLIMREGYKRYLEIGVYNCYHFNDVKIEEKSGVDPSPKKDDPIYQKWRSCIYEMTSKTFFQNYIGEKFDIIFIDGCLYEENVMNDVEQSLSLLGENGTIVLHDCNPPMEFFQRDKYETRYYGSKMNNVIWNNKTYTDRHWNGKVWKVIAKLRMMRMDLEINVVNCDWGVGIIRFGKGKLLEGFTMEELESYATLEKYRKHILNLISPLQFLEIYK